MRAIGKGINFSTVPKLVPPVEVGNRAACVITVDDPEYSGISYQECAILAYAS
jgi:hypothetical protein